MSSRRRTLNPSLPLGIVDVDAQAQIIKSLLKCPGEYVMHFRILHTRRTRFHFFEFASVIVLVGRPICKQRQLNAQVIRAAECNSGAVYDESGAHYDIRGADQAAHPGAARGDPAYDTPTAAYSLRNSLRRRSERAHYAPSMILRRVDCK